MADRKQEIDVSISAMAALSLVTQLLKGLIEAEVMTSDQGLKIVADAIDAVHTEQREDVRAAVKTVFPDLPV